MFCFRPFREVKTSPLKPDEWFLMVVGDFPVDMALVPVDTLVDFWNEEMTWAVDTSVSRHSMLDAISQVAPWFTDEQQAKDSFQFI